MKSITQKTSEVPKSGCFKISITGKTVMIAEIASLRFDVATSLVYAKNRERAKIKATFAISEGARFIGPNENHRVAPMRVDGFTFQTATWVFPTDSLE